MASRLEWFDVTIPGNTPVASPVSIPLNFNQGVLLGLRFYIPPGPAGNVGFQLWSGGGQVWPTTPKQYFILDSLYLAWELTDAPDTGSWSFVAYNTDLYAHLIQVGFDIAEFPRTSTGVSTRTPIGI